MVKGWLDGADVDFMTSRPLWHHLAGGGVAVAMLIIAFGAGRRVPLLGYADLGFHELGHLVTALLGTTISFLMGSGTQVLVPLGLAAYFWLKRRDLLATGLMLVWGATSLQDASVYIADAPYQRLPLIGGHHDWAYLLGHWGVVHRAEDIAGFVWFVGLAVGVGGLIGIAWRPAAAVLQRFETTRDRRYAATLPVRRIRRIEPPWTKRTDRS